MKNTPKAEQDFNRAVAMSAAVLKVPVEAVAKAVNQIPGLREEVAKRAWTAMFGEDGEARILTASQWIKGKSWNIKITNGKDSALVVHAENFRGKIIDKPAVIDGAVKCHYDNFDKANSF
jgi:hypothetical protein